LMGERPKDQTVWVKNSNGLHDAAMASMKAAQEKNVDAWKASLGAMGAACKGCHTVHRKRPQQQEQKQ
ncbi:MAG: cytochrome c, partial [Bryobacteraceae bacterium]